MTGKNVILCTAPTQTEAQSIARGLVSRHLAACVNVVGPIESVYRWKGDVESSGEWLLVVKTTAELVDDVCDAIREMHSYELPECIALPITAGSADYLAWIGESVTSGTE